MLVGAGCYSSTSTSTTTKTSGTGNAVTMSNLTFSPSSLTVKKGTAVTWTNNDSVAHTVTGDNGGPASGQLGNGKTYSFTFDTVGTVAYHCSNHPSMTASVTVTP
ncbi:MAG: cupredoxin domain-containing protein [Candidatus Kerfeldbacteria bacterium]|nr:cupredoxin domain-containing protein [Candidatus Kerfeldbacteria bacterium]